jgi:hypothetical protein
MFKSAKNANKHMRQQHPDQEFVLHDIVNELKAAPKSRTNVVAQRGGVHLSSGSSDDDDDDRDGKGDGAWGGDDGGGDDDGGDDDGGDDNGGGGGSGGGGDDDGGNDNGGGGGSGGGGDDVGRFSEYERNGRLKNIERNAAMLNQLGISSMLDMMPQIKRKSEGQKQSRRAKRQAQQGADASRITRSRTSNTVSSISYCEKSDSALESAEDLTLAQEEDLAELKSDDSNESTKAQMNAHAIAMQELVQPRPPSQPDAAVAAVVVDTAAVNGKWVDGKWVDDQCMVNHFALLKIENADTKAISIELVKITQTSTSEPEFKGTMYLCTQLQTSEECLHAMWYVSQTRNSPCDPDSVICYFRALNNSGKLPAIAKRAATAIFK